MKIVNAAKVCSRLTKETLRRPSLNRRLIETRKKNRKTFVLKETVDSPNIGKTKTHLENLIEHLHETKYISNSITIKKIKGGK